MYLSIGSLVAIKALRTPGFRGAVVSRRYVTTGDGMVAKNSWSVTCREADDIETLGAKIAPFIGNGDVILLRGDLGAGKTTFSRGIIRSKFEDEDMRVTSPSYLLDNSYEYDEGKYIHHMDLYRLPTGCDLSMLNIPEIFETTLCLIEWPQRMGTNLPKEYLDVDIRIQKDELRLIDMTAYGEKWVKKMTENFGSPTP
jgi:tRNA threonylcarbamoyl adenosine modification protein YjeE